MYREKIRENFKIIHLRIYPFMIIWIDRKSYWCLASDPIIIIINAPSQNMQSGITLKLYKFELYKKPLTSQWQLKKPKQ
jgi:hypothetical protein